MTPFVSVVLPCRNEVLFIDRCLDSILESDYPGPFEIIVADGMSTDGTRERLSLRGNRIRILDNPEGITPIALNRAIAASAGDVIVRFDGHAVMPVGYIRRCVDLLMSSHADNAGGCIRTVAPSAGLFSEAIAFALSSRFGVGGSSFRTLAGETGARPADTVFAGCWRREIFSRLGGFNEKLVRSQDMEFNLRIQRAGGVILLDPSIVCDYFSRPTLAGFWRHNFRNGVWAVLPFAFSHYVPVRARHLIPFVFVCLLTMSLFLPFPWFFAVAATYAGANLAASAHLAFVERELSQFFLLPIVFASLHLAYGLGSAWGFLKVLALKLDFKGAPKRASRLET